MRLMGRVFTTGPGEDDAGRATPVHRRQNVGKVFPNRVFATRTRGTNGPLPDYSRRAKGSGEGPGEISANPPRQRETVEPLVPSGSGAIPRLFPDRPTPEE
jgi:hypothetical protein